MKKWYHSKSLWVMAVALVASIISGVTGETWVDGEMQATILSIIGIILRAVTKEGLTK